MIWSRTALVDFAWIDPVGMDGWSIHPYSPCFWKSHYVNINGNAFAWEHNATSGEWVKQNPTVHTANLELIAEFEELQLNDFDLALKAHPAHTVPTKLLGTPPFFQCILMALRVLEKME